MSPHTEHHLQDIYQPPHIQEDVPSNLSEPEYPTSQIIVGYAILPPLTCLIISLLFSLILLNPSPILAGIIAAIFASVVSTIPALFTGLCIAAFRLHNTLFGMVSASLIAAVFAITPAWIYGLMQPDESVLGLMKACASIAFIASLFMAARVLPEKATTTPLPADEIHETIETAAQIEAFTELPTSVSKEPDDVTICATSKPLIRRSSRIDVYYLDEIDFSKLRQ